MYNGSTTEVCAIRRKAAWAWRLLNGLIPPLAALIIVAVSAVVVKRFGEFAKG